MKNHRKNFSGPYSVHPSKQQQQQNRAAFLLIGGPNTKLRKLNFQRKFGGNFFSRPSLQGSKL